MSFGKLFTPRKCLLIKGTEKMSKNNKRSSSIVYRGISVGISIKKKFPTTTKYLYLLASVIGDFLVVRRCFFRKVNNGYMYIRKLYSDQK